MSKEKLACSLACCENQSNLSAVRPFSEAQAYLLHPISMQQVKAKIYLYIV